jgi:hypothetical protein
MASKGNQNSNPLPPKGGGREFNLTTSEGILGQTSSASDQGDQAARTSSPAPVVAQTGAIATGTDRDDKVLNTEPVNDTPGAGLDLSRESYRGSEEPPLEAQAIKDDELSNPLQIGGQLVQDAPFTAEPHVPPGLVPMPGKEEFNADDQGRNPYPVPVEGTGSNHVAYATGEVDSEKES